jgi:hypothetical protein
MSRGKMNSEIPPRRMNSAAAQVRWTSASRSWLSVAFFGAAWKSATPRAATPARVVAMLSIAHEVRR